MTSGTRHDARSPVHASSRSGAATEARQRILEAAQQQFSARGYEQTSLLDVADEVGLTRGAVLYHFGSKAELMQALVQPYLDLMQDNLSNFEQADRAPRPATVLAAVLDALLDHRSAADLLTRDVSGRHALDLDPWLRRTVRRLVKLLAPPAHDDPHARIRGLAALGALVRPLADLPDPLPAGGREAILDAAAGALRRPRRR